LTVKGVEPWVSGCWRRDSIIFADGTADRETTVFWVQSGRYCGDIRAPATRPDLAAAQASLSQCHMTDDSAVWERELAFHPKRHFPEPGLLSLDGEVMTERAPSGAYVEAWRRQPGSDGLRAAYALEGPRSGRLVIAGDHLYLALDRPAPLAGDQTLQEMLAAGADPKSLFDCEFSYARREGDGFVIQASTIPALEGRPMAGLKAASFQAETFAQEVEGMERVWRRLYDGRD
jgi:hypothetical protein